ncbi:MULTISPECIES: hypothetical protein [Sphingomonas]|uniref:hypothetical protein n=1 Tax=Sphingomonas TaxID=13687 RepID=UPI000B17F8E9|nr:hypothetical protein [Sphingomonas sp. CCH10-B3]
MKKSILAAAILTATISGCATDQGGMPDSKAIVGSGARFASVEGKQFYLFQPGFTCIAPIPGSAPMPSWVDRIEVIEGKLIRWGSRCNNEGLTLPAAELADAKLGADQTLVIAGKTYRVSAQPEKEAEGMK